MAMKKKAHLGHVRFDCHWQGLSVDGPALNHHRDHITTTNGSGQLCYSHMFISSKNTEHHQKKWYTALQKAWMGTANTKQWGRA